MTTTPDPTLVGTRAATILALVRESEEYARLITSSLRYPDCWATFTGYPLISQWDLSRDAMPLFEQALRVLCLKAAVFELTGGDEEAAELVVSAPVDEMVHAILAQYTLCVQLTARLAINWVHMTDKERFGWRRGDYTHMCYRAAGWGEPPQRYWIEDKEARRRLKILNQRYRSIGIRNAGRTHDIDFNNPEPAPEPALQAG